MRDVITIKPGRPDGYERVLCRHCEWEGFVPNEMIEKLTSGRCGIVFQGRVECPHCGKTIMISRS